MKYYVAVLMLFLALICNAQIRFIGPMTINSDVNPYYNSSMIGQSWTFTPTSGQPCTTTITNRAMTPSNYYSQNAIIMRIDKDQSQCYWAGGVPFAIIDFVLQKCDSNGSMCSPGFIDCINSGPGGIDCTTSGIVPSFWPCASAICSMEIVQSANTNAIPYMIVPPQSLQPGQVLTYGPTAYDQYNDSNGINWNNFVFSFELHARNQYWMTQFYIDSVTGYAVSNQYEADCGHEIWYWQKNVGLVRRESPNDGHPGGTASCVQFAIPTMVRTN